MTFELNDEIVEEVTLAGLISSYEITLDILKNTINNDIIGVHSFNFDEEIFALVEDLKSLERVIEMFGVKKHSVDNILREFKEDVYIQVRDFEELKKINQMLVNKTHVLTEELDDLKDKIKNILG